MENGFQITRKITVRDSRKPIFDDSARNLIRKFNFQHFKNHFLTIEIHPFQGPYFWTFSFHLLPDFTTSHQTQGTLEIWTQTLRDFMSKTSVEKHQFSGNELNSKKNVLNPHDISRKFYQKKILLKSTPTRNDKIKCLIPLPPMKSNSCEK